MKQEVSLTDLETANLESLVNYNAGFGESFNHLLIRTQLVLRTNQERL